MASLYEKRLLPMGDGGLVVYLPKPWLRYYGLGRGDTVILIADDEIRIRPKGKEGANGVSKNQGGV